MDTSLATLRPRPVLAGADVAPATAPPEPAAVPAAVPAATPAAGDPRLTVVVPPGCARRLSRPRGATLQVVGGRVWVTQTGCRRDRVLGAGDALVLAASGVVVIEPFDPGPATLRLQPGPTHRRARPRRPLGRLPAVASRLVRRLHAAATAWLARRRTLRSLDALDAAALRDVDLTEAIRTRVALRREADRRALEERCRW